MIKVSDRRFSRLKSWALIFFLSLLPGIIFLWDWNPEGEGDFRREIVSQEWFRRMDKVADRFGKSSDRSFWCSLSVERFKNLVYRELESKKTLSSAFAKSWANYRPDNFPTASVQVFFKQKKAWQNQSFGPRVYTSDYLVRKLFSEMVLKAGNFADNLSDKNWEQRIKTLFGHMIFPDLFFEENRSTPFSALIKKRPYRVIWDFIYDKKNQTIIGGYFFYFPENYDEKILPDKLILQYWQMICDEEGIYPVMLPLNSEDPSLIVHPAIDKPQLRKDLEKFRLNYIKRVPSPVPELADKARLPGEISGSTFNVGSYLARLCILSAECGHVGLILGSRPAPQNTLRQQISDVYFTIAAIFWGMFLFRLVLFREVPTVNLRFRVMAWFLAFAAFPAGLTISAWSSLIQDFEDYRIEQMQKALHQSVLNIETGLSKIDSFFLEASKSVINKKGFLDSIIELPENPENDEKVFEKVFSDYHQKGIDIDSAMLIVQGGWCFRSFKKDSTAKDKAGLRNGIAALINQVFANANPEVYQRFTPPGGKYADKKVPAILNMADLDVYDNVKSLRDIFDGVSDINSDNKNYLQFLYQFNAFNGPFAVLVVHWDWTEMVEKKIRLLMAEESLRFKKSWGVVPDFSVFRASPQGIMPVCHTGHSSQMQKMAEFPVSKLSRFLDSFSASIMVPSARLPDLRMVARASVADVKLLVAEEKGMIVFSVTALLLIIVIGASGATIWITRPIKKISEILGSLSSANEPGTYCPARKDELGLAARSITRMTEWILQRQRLVKFISPKVLEVVSGGNAFKAGAGTLQEVTILVSDIRSFTTITEEQTVEEVFEMVNNHLARMASDIKDCSGIIDRYVGDAVWAVFFDQHPKGGINALKAAQKMMKSHRQIQQDRLHANKFRYDIGIGIVKGKVLAGVMGDSSVRLDYTIVGEALNEAERLEDLSKTAGLTGIVFSEELRECALKAEIPFVKLAAEVCEVSSLE
jgi:class 3 adenylate cyclase